VAGEAVLGDDLPVFGRVLVVVAAEATGGGLVTDVVGVRAPVDAHGRENIGAVDLHERVPRLAHERALARGDFGILLSVERIDGGTDLQARVLQGIVVRP
jgi:hypothetical protein